jgi:hypothetical protein
MRRYILDLDRSNDAVGHGITELTFEETTVSISPGRNEDYIVIKEGRIPSDSLDPLYWSLVDMLGEASWKAYKGERLECIDCYSDGIEDVALIFRFQSGISLSIALHETDLIIARGLEPFDESTEELDLFLRERIAATTSP